MELIGGAIVGAAVVLFGRSLLGGISAALRPAAKGVVKGSVAAYEAVASTASELTERVGDFMAEASAETPEAPAVAAANGQPARKRRGK
jgi:uncharacterized protein DUF5132